MTFSWCLVRHFLWVIVVKVRKRFLHITCKTTASASFAHLLCHVLLTTPKVHGREEFGLQFEFNYSHSLENCLLQAFLRAQRRKSYTKAFAYLRMNKPVWWYMHSCKLLIHIVKQNQTSLGYIWQSLGSISLLLCHANKCLFCPGSGWVISTIFSTALPGLW